MDIHIQGHNLKVNAALEDYAQKKLERLYRFLPNISDVRLDFSRENTRRGEDLAKAQITVRHMRGAILRAEERVPGDAQAALNLALDNMYRQIQRFKGKRSRKGKERFSATVDELQQAEQIPDMEEFEEAPEFAEISRRKDVLITAMKEEEAIEQMELLGHTFFIFFNDATGSINVIYKRRAGGYGVLNPQVE
jgi:putative sigma-54 modulation protein